MPILDNARHERFAQGLAKGLTADAAYTEAGYTPNRHNAARLNTNEHIRARVDELQSRATEGIVITKQWLIEQLVDTAKRAKEDATRSAEVAALKELATLTGHRVERQEHDSNVNLNVISDEPMTEEEWEARMAGDA